MPVWIVVALLAGGAAVLSVRALKRWLSRPGKVAFIGRNATGKTTMAEILEHGQAQSKAYTPTTVAREVQQIQIGEKTFTLIDSSGDHLKDWKTALRGAKDVVYFFDANEVAKRNPRVMSELDADAEHLERLKNGHRVTLIGTHADLFEDHLDEQRVRSSLQIANLKAACGVGAEGVLIGSLMDKRGGRRLARQIAERHG